MTLHPHQRLVVAVLSVLAGLLGAQSTFGQHVNLSGFVRDANGVPLTEDVELTISFFLAPDDAVPVWSTTQMTFVADGILSLGLEEIPSQQELEDALVEELWMGVQIGEHPELLPRFNLGSVFRARFAERAEVALNSLSTAPQGPAGPIGAQGPPGDQGLVGEPGPRGPTNDVRGPKGPKGFDGPRGAQGMVGEPGERGEQGINGVAGPRGPDGWPLTSSNTFASCSSAQPGQLPMADGDCNCGSGQLVSREYTSSSADVDQCTAESDTGLCLATGLSGARGACCVCRPPQ